MSKSDRIYLFSMAIGFLIGALFTTGAYKAGIEKGETFLINSVYYSCKVDRK